MVDCLGECPFALLFGEARGRRWDEGDRADLLSRRPTASSSSSSRTRCSTPSIASSSTLLYVPRSLYSSFLGSIADPLALSLNFLLTHSTTTTPSKSTPTPRSTPSTSTTSNSLAESSRSPFSTVASSMPTLSPPCTRWSSRRRLPSSIWRVLMQRSSVRLLGCCEFLTAPLAFLDSARR